MKYLVQTSNSARVDMHSFLIRLLLPLYFVISMSLVISHAKAIEHPRPRPVRSKDKHISVNVRPKTIDFYPGDTITISCRAKGGNKIEDTPYISFYRQMPDVGHMKLTSGDPGIKIEPVTAPDSANELKVKKLLHLSKWAWHMLSHGENVLYCRSFDRFGHSTDAHFFVNKKSYHTVNDTNRRRRFSIHRLRHRNHHIASATL